MDDWFGPVHDATVDLIVRAGYRVIVPDSQTCCGALAAHDGLADIARDLARKNIGAFAAADLVISDSAGCTAHLKDYGHWADGGDELAAKTRDVTEFVAWLIAQGLLPELPATGKEVAMQDPCHLRHAQRIVAEPRSIVRAAGMEPVEIDQDGLCCGAAGIYSVFHPDTSAKLGSDKAKQIASTGATVVASANPGCEMQLRAHLDTEYQVRHPVEIYHEALLTSSVEYALAGS
jgi:glycolate oxidase iron-sulfur subunit